MIVAAAEMSMSEVEFWDTTPAYFMARHHAHRRECQERLEQVRFISFIVAKTVDTSGAFKKPADLIPFSWDPAPKEFAPLTEEDRVELRKFDDDADQILKITNPEAYALYIAGKNGSQRH